MQAKQRICFIGPARSGKTYLINRIVSTGEQAAPYAATALVTKDITVVPVGSTQSLQLNIDEVGGNFFAFLQQGIKTQPIQNYCIVVSATDPNLEKNLEQYLNLFQSVDRNIQLRIVVTQIDRLESQQKINLSNDTLLQTIIPTALPNHIKRLAPVYCSSTTGENIEHVFKDFYPLAENSTKPLDVLETMWDESLDFLKKSPQKFVDELEQLQQLIKQEFKPPEEQLPEAKPAEQQLEPAAESNPPGSTPAQTQAAGQQTTSEQRGDLLEAKPSATPTPAPAPATASASTASGQIQNPNTPPEQRPDLQELGPLEEQVPEPKPAQLPLKPRAESNPPGSAPAQTQAGGQQPTLEQQVDLSESEPVATPTPAPAPAPVAPSASPTLEQIPKQNTQPGQQVDLSEPQPAAAPTPEPAAPSASSTLEQIQNQNTQQKQRPDPNKPNSAPALPMSAQIPGPSSNPDPQRLTPEPEPINPAPKKQGRFTRWFGASSSGIKNWFTLALLGTTSMVITGALISTLPFKLFMGLFFAGFVLSCIALLACLLTGIMWLASDDQQTSDLKEMGKHKWQYALKGLLSAATLAVFLSIALNVLDIPPLRAALDFIMSGFNGLGHFFKIDLPEMAILGLTIAGFTLLSYLVLDLIFRPWNKVVSDYDLSTENSCCAALCGLSDSNIVDEIPEAVDNAHEHFSQPFVPADQQAITQPTAQAPITIEYPVPNSKPAARQSGPPLIVADI